MPSSLRLLPVIVLYRQQLHTTTTYQTLLKVAAFEQFMVYDNSPADFEVDSTTLDQRAIYVRNSYNRGLSSCYNLAAHYAQSEGFTHLLLLDQDTTFPPGALQHYFHLPATTFVAAPCLTSDTLPFSPVDIRGWNLRAAKLPSRLHSLHQYSPVNSGLCVQVETFFRAGGYDESVYLDYADFVFVRRLAHVTSHFLLLPFTAEQNFSNSCPSSRQLQYRLKHYLHSAAHVRSPHLSDCLKLIYQTLRHTASIGLRTRSFSPFAAYLRHFILKRKP